MKILLCGDPHGQFEHINAAALDEGAEAVVLLGDMEPSMPLHEELASLIEQRLPIHWIHGNHDADSNELWMRVWGSDLVDQSVHGRVVELADGTRLAGLGGVFRASVWYPDTNSAGPAFRTRAAHAKATPRQDRWGGSGTHRKHWGTIYPEEVERLSKLRADILVTHEAPGYHPHGFDVLDNLARAMDVRVTVHGHQHDALDSSARWAEQGFRSYGVGLRGLSMLDTATMAWTIIRPGALDGQHGGSEPSRI